MSWSLWVEEALDHLDQCEQGAGEDDRHDAVSSPSLPAGAAHQERDTEGDGGHGVAAVVDDVREQRDAAAQQVHHELDD
jgi:hypothetical protein